MEKVETKIIPSGELEENLEDIARRVRDGAIIVYPTDTVYGVGASLERPEQIRRIFKIKGRTLRKPMALLVSRRELVEEYVTDVTGEAKRLMEEFWPGPMTLVLPVKNDSVPEVVNGGGDSIGVRLPAHTDAIRILDACGGVLATTSANTSQDEDAITFGMARSYFEGKVEIMIDGGSSPIGIPSSVVSCTEDSVSVLREGGIPEERILECCGE